MIKIFEDDVSPREVLDHVLEHGIAGIAGQRTATRNRLGEVGDLAKRSRRPEVHAVATIHHFWAELAFIYDERIYRFDQAKKAVHDAYDKELAEQGMNLETT